MAGFKNVRSLVASLTDDGKTWISSFRKAVAGVATIAGHWYDYSYAGGNPIPNYYAASPLAAEVLDRWKGIILPRINSDEKLFIHRLDTMSAAASATTTTSQGQHLILLDYLLYYPFVDMDAAGDDQVMDNTVPLPRYANGIGVQMMMVAQSPTVGGGGFTVTYIDDTDTQRVTPSLYCAAPQPAGGLVQAVNAAGGLAPFLPLEAGVRGVKSVVSVNFSVANGGLCAVVLVKPLDQTQIYQESRRTTTGTIESFGDCVEREAMTNRPGIIEIDQNAFLSFIGRGTQGSIASSVLVGTLETVWR